MLLAIAGVVLAMLVVPSTGHAAPEGCIALGTQNVQPNNQRPWDCYFKATGESYFAADTTNPYVISVSRDGGATWIDLVRRGTIGTPAAGRLLTQPGDLVGVSITCYDYTRARHCGSSDLTGGRFGVVVVHSAP